MKNIFSLLVLLHLIVPAMAQEPDKPAPSKREERRQRIIALARMEEEGVVAHKKHFAFGAKLTTDGYGGWLEIGRARDVKSGLLFQLDISERKHAKEEKQQVDFSSAFIYGKINYFYPVKLGVQYQRVLGNKSNKNGVRITANGGGGVSLGMLRPYLLTVADSSGLSKKIDFHSDTMAFLNRFAVRQGPRFGDGWSKIKVTPGLYAKTGVRFDYGKFNEMINAIEVGVILEYYTKEIEQMAFDDHRKLFFSGYFSLVFGKRKN